jgi:hypothetical protein
MSGFQLGKNMNVIHPSADTDWYRIQPSQRSAQVLKDGLSRIGLKIRGPVLGAKDEMIVELMMG